MEATPPNAYKVSGTGFRSDDGSTGEGQEILSKVQAKTRSPMLPSVPLNEVPMIGGRRGREAGLAQVAMCTRRSRILLGGESARGTSQVAVERERYHGWWPKDSSKEKEAFTRIRETVLGIECCAESHHVAQNMTESDRKNAPDADAAKREMM